MRIYQNYHRHGNHTNVRVPDSVAKNEDYAKRAIELGHGIISTMEHGSQGRYIEGYELSKKYNLKFVFGTEAYFVKNRFEQDKTNAHICLFARTENARQCLNDVLSEANITGFYYRPRLDLELILSLPKDEIICTSACLAFWQYEDIDDIVIKLNNHFKYFYLEVQNHNTDSQKKINSHILEISEFKNIPIIFGVDSHYISNDKAWERDDYLASKGIIYQDEEGWYLDYPDGDTAYQRFIDQGILSEEQINEAMNNTNIFLEIEEYNSTIFNKEIKMPTLYPDLTQEEKDILYKNLIYQKWEETKPSILKNLHKLYEKEIEKEVNDVIITKHADYFLLDYEIVKRGIEKGGRITNSGRGSGVSYITNKLLGFTKIDRVAAKVKMYPERFISPTRILESKSLADLDLNLGNPLVFAEAQTEIFGEDHSYPMIAYGTYKAKSAFKMFAKAKKMDFELANNISQQIEEYEKALKYAEDDEKDDINIYDYVEEQYHSIIKDSEEYLGIISDMKVHACAYLVYEGDIRREIGLIKTKSKSGKERLCTLMDGHWAEDYKFLKNDLLKVDVVNLIKLTYERIGIPDHDEQELIKICENNQKVWDVYKNGWVMGINQCERSATKHKVMKYMPQNMSEICAFVAAIRPGFKSMYSKFENREPFSYDIPTFDKLIQTLEMHNSFLLYQEMSMTALNFAGIPMSECYEIIKHISKKREEKVKGYKDQFLKGFAERIQESENKTLEESQELAHKIWQIISDSSFYQFNASHAYSVALDSLYGAYLKSYYPLYFYEVFLNLLFNKTSSKDRIAQVKQEATKAFGIKFISMEFGQDNTKYTLDEKNNTIYSALSSIKGIGNKIAIGLLELKDNKYECFINILSDIKKYKICDTSQLNDLIKLRYFNKWGNNEKLLKIHQYYQSIFNAKVINKNKLSTINISENLIKKYSRETDKQYRDIDTNNLLNEIISQISDTPLFLQEQLKVEYDKLNYCQTTIPLINYTILCPIELNLNFTPRIKFYNISTGQEEEYKIYKNIYKQKPFEPFNLIRVKQTKVRPKSKVVGHNPETNKPIFEQLEETENYIMDYVVMSEKEKQQFNSYIISKGWL